MITRMKRAVFSLDKYFRSPSGYALFIQFQNMAREALIDKRGRGKSKHCLLFLGREADSSECAGSQGCLPSWGGVGYALLCMGVAAVAH